MPRYGIVGPDNRTITDIIIVPGRFRRDGPAPAASIAELEARAAAKGDGSRVVETGMLPTEGKNAKRLQPDETIEWDNGRKELVIVTRSIE